MGGTGAYRTADDTDFAAVRAGREPLVGFSGITSFYPSLLERCGVVGIHGWLVGDEAVAGVGRLLMGTESITLRRDENAVSAHVGSTARRGVR